MQTWQRNLYTLWVAELVAIAGFTVVVPFLPYYVQELGVRDLAQVEFWSGVLFASHAMAMAVFSPLWGKVHNTDPTDYRPQRCTAQMLPGLAP